MKSILSLAAIILASIAHAQSDSLLNATSKDTSYKSIMIQARFPGGPEAWGQYLQKSLRADVAAENVVLKRRQKDSMQTVMISFLVDTLGNVTEVKIENPQQVHPAVGAEAMRVIARGPKWLPATINGKKVIYRQKQSISFLVTAK